MNGELRIEYRRLSEISEAILNPRKHDLVSLKNSIDVHGFGDSLIEDTRTGRLVAGHGRLKDLRGREASGESMPSGVRAAEDGEWMAPVQVGWSSKDDAHATSFLLSSNKTVENSEWIPDEVAALIAALEEVDPALVAAAGFDQEAISEAIAAADGERLLETDDSDDFVTVQFRVPQATADLWRAAVDMYDGTESEKIRKLAESATGEQPPF